MRRRQDCGTSTGRAAGSCPALVLVVLTLLPGLAMAGPRKPHHDQGSRQESWHAAPRGEATGRCPGMSLDQAIANAERKYKARVVKASTEGGGDRCTYVLRLLSDEGRVWTVRVDSRSGG